jgi:hypothetical protein
VKFQIQNFFQEFQNGPQVLQKPADTYIIETKIEMALDPAETL